MKSFYAVIALIFISALPVYAGKWSTGTTAPATCTVGDSWTDTDGTADNRFYTCTVTNTWTLNSNQTAIDAKADKAQAVRYWADHADETTLAVGTLVAYEGKIYATTQAFLKTSGATPVGFSAYFEPIAGATYTLPAATANTLGGVKVGERLTITDGVLSADVQSGTGAVDSVNGKTGTVVLTPDDMVDTSTTNKFVTDAEKSAWNAKLGALPTWLPDVGPTADNQIIQATAAGSSRWTDVFDGLINDAGTGTDDLWSASKNISMLAAKDNKQPSTLSLTEDITVTSSQLLDNKYLSNHGSTGTVKIILPAVEYQITRTAIVEAAYTVKICPPSGEALNVNGTDLTVDYCTISPVIVGSKTTVTRRKNGVGWIWDVDGVRGTWTTGL